MKVTWPINGWVCLSLNSVVFNIITEVVLFYINDSDHSLPGLFLKHLCGCDLSSITVCLLRVKKAILSRIHAEGFRRQSFSCVMTHDPRHHLSDQSWAMRTKSQRHTNLFTYTWLKNFDTFHHQRSQIQPIDGIQRTLCATKTNISSRLTVPSQLNLTNIVSILLSVSKSLHLLKWACNLLLCRGLGTTSHV